ncbi:MAG: sugar ABC transporter permease [Lachnospiraceae bacterium]|nr:sugar ABC transporter permease [Lachnospiraceae bacterium]
MNRLAAKRQREKNKIIIAFLIVPLLFLLYFTVYPVVTMLLYSFTDWKGSATPFSVLGVKNYVEIFTTDTYRNIFKTASYYLVAGIVQQLISLFLAVIMGKALRGSGIFKGFIFFPFIMNGVAVSMVFRMFYQIGGGLDVLLKAIGMEQCIRVWMTNPVTSNICLAFIYLWKNVGYSFLIYLGTMQSVPGEYYDAAAIDGAGMWMQFKEITFPAIKMIIGMMVTLSIVGSISVFDIPYVLTNGKNSTNSFATTLVETAFTYSRYGLACAMAIIMLLLAAIVMVFKNMVFKEENDNGYNR